MLYAKHLSGQLPRFLSLEEIKNPQQVISDFFDIYHIAHARQLLQKWLRSAFAEKSYIGRSEFNLLLDLQKWLIRLLEAGQQLEGHKSEYDDAPKKLEAAETDMMSPSNYYSAHPKYQPWDCFPRHLSRHEYNLPGCVFGKLLSHMEVSQWCLFLEELFAAATSEIKVNSIINNDDLYLTAISLFKLLEACHLIHVREMNNAAGTAHGDAYDFVERDMAEMAKALWPAGTKIFQKNE